MVAHNKRGSDGKFITKDQKGYIPPSKSTRRLITLFNYLLDGSGSMESVRSQVIDGFRNYISDLRDDRSNEILFSLTIFNSAGGFNENKVNLSRPYVISPISQVTALNQFTYKPNGNTPLYDAIGKTIEEVDEVIRNRAITIDRIMTIIHTDGQENASKSWDRSSIKSLMNEKVETGHWTFTYMGTDINAWHDAQSLGISKDNFFKYQPQHTDRAYAGFGMASTAYLVSSDLQAKAFFTNGVKMVNNVPVVAKKRHEHISASQPGKIWTATEWEDGTWSCNCLSWANRKTCKHIGGGVSALPQTPRKTTKV